MANSFGSRSTLNVGSRSFTIYRLDAIEKQIPAVKDLPFTLRVLLEGLLRTEDGVAVRDSEIEALAK